MNWPQPGIGRTQTIDNGAAAGTEMQDRQLRRQTVDQRADGGDFMPEGHVPEQYTLYTFTLE